MWRVYLKQSRFAGPFAQRLGRQPGWVVRATLMCAAAAIVPPLIVVMVIGLLITVVVFVVLSVIARLLGLVGLGGGGQSSPRSFDDGRDNVRVIEPE